MRKLFRFLKGYRHFLVLGPLFKFIEAVFELCIPIIVSRIIDIGIKNQDSSYVMKMGVVLFALAAAGLAFALSAQYFAAVAQQGVGNRLRTSLFSHIGTLSCAELDRFGTASLVTRLTNDVNQLQNAVAMFIRIVMRAPFLIIGSVFMSFMIDVQLALILCVVVPLILLTIYWIMSRSVPKFKKIQTLLDRISTITRENLSGARVVRAFSASDTEIKRFEESSETLADASVRAGQLSALMNPLNSLIMNFGIIAVLWFGGLRVNAGNLSQGETVALINYITQIILALVAASNLVITFTKAAASAARVNEVFDTKSSVTDGSVSTVDFASASNAIVFDHVSFAYSKKASPAVSDVSFSIKNGETVGIIGGTGSGKTTLAALLMRQYDVDQGHIYVADRDIREYDRNALYRNISMVVQSPVIISGTVADNVRMGNEEIKDDNVEAALKTAMAWDFVSALPTGIHTHISRGGKNLSGGQKQRLSIARSLAVCPGILILDDSFSALDAATDYALRQNLKKELASSTVIMISQRISSIRHLDHIIVVDDGHIVGEGTHDELYQNCEVYHEIVLSQQQGGEHSEK